MLSVSQGARRPRGRLDRGRGHDTEIGRFAEQAERDAKGAVADAVVWGAGRGAHGGERRAVGRLPALHGPRRAHRRGRDPARPAHPGGRRDGRRPGVRADRRLLRRRGAAPAAAGRPLGARAGGRLPAGDRAGLRRHAALQGDRPGAGGLRRRGRHHLRPHLQSRLLRVLRRRLRGGGRDALARDREVGRPDRRPHLGHHDPGPPRGSGSPPPTATGRRSAGRPASSPSTWPRSSSRAPPPSTSSASPTAAGASGTSPTAAARRPASRSGARATRAPAPPAPTKRRARTCSRAYTSGGATGGP